MKTLFYTLVLVFTLTSCCKSEIEDLKSAKISLPDIKNIEWRRYDAMQVCTISFINDSIFRFTRANYTKINTLSSQYFGQYKLTTDSLVLTYNLNNIAKPIIYRYSYKANSDSICLYFNAYLVQKYYSKKQHTTY